MLDKSWDAVESVLTCLFIRSDVGDQVDKNGARDFIPDVKATLFQPYAPYNGIRET